ncbi:MAG TPA: GNAT family N-acetyltransferase [Sandaracinaceae bacterium LLY-WYZ-13_1]|nr:GNAT family N-acetyltransferase [Sandaracinaceae bacterium LLY-WYZ-13_1]
MSNPSFQIRRAGRDDADATLDVLERALAADPFVSWLARPGAGHARARRSYLRLMLERIALPRGIVYVAESAGGALWGASLWAPPGTFELSAGETLKLMPLMLDVVGLSRMPRIGRVLDAVDAARPPEPRWLLTLLGTLPDRRGRGVGSALLRPALERCDDAGLRAVLETADPGNLAFYRRFGFEVAARRPLGDDGPESFTMVREPVRER